MVLARVAGDGRQIVRGREDALHLLEVLETGALDDGWMVPCLAGVAVRVPMESIDATAAFEAAEFRTQGALEDGVIERAADVISDEQALAEHFKGLRNNREGVLGSGRSVSFQLQCKCCWNALTVHRF